MMEFHDPATGQHASSGIQGTTPGGPPHSIERPVMLQEWRNITFIHHRVAPDHVQALLPDGLTVDTFDGSAWVGLVPFHMVGVTVPGMPRIPYLGTFPETNVRTYVVDRSGRPGVWFHSLEASRLIPVWTARTGYTLPYMWARMDITESRGTIRYVSRRRWPGRSGAGGVITVRPSIEPVPQDDLDRFLTARWGLFTSGPKGSLRYAPVEHPPWQLHEAELPHIRDTLLASAGYVDLEPAAHIRWSSGASVRVGLPRRVR